MYAFISDAHLSGNNNEKVELFIKTVRLLAEKQGVLYLLGDVFDFWAGNDASRDSQQYVLSALKEAVDAGTKIFLITGNRDFLIGDEFSRKTGVKILPELYPVIINDNKFLLTHGDLLCTKDFSYQIFRKIVRSFLFKWIFLSLPLKLRAELVHQTKKQTKKSVNKKSMDIMDVDQKAVIDFMSKYGATCLIHGHTHQAGIHEFSEGDTKLSRIVLGDWDGCSSILIISQNEKQLMSAHTFINNYS